MPDNFTFTFDNHVIYMNNLKTQQECPSGFGAFIFKGNQHTGFLTFPAIQLAFNTNELHTDKE